MVVAIMPPAEIHCISALTGAEFPCRVLHSVNSAREKATLPSQQESILSASNHAVLCFSILPTLRHGTLHLYSRALLSAASRESLVGDRRSPGFCLSLPRLEPAHHERMLCAERCRTHS